MTYSEGEYRVFTEFNASHIHCGISHTHLRNMPYTAEHGLYGDNIYQGMFAKELKDAEEKRVSPESLGVPDISKEGNYQVRWNWVLFDNLMVKLLNFSPRSKADIRSEDYDDQEMVRKSSPAYIAAPHLAFWVQDDTDLREYVMELERRSNAAGFEKIKCSRMTEIKNEEDRYSVPIEAFANVYDSEDSLGGGGLGWVYCKGPNGEQIEFIKFAKSSGDKIRDAFCARKSLTTKIYPAYKDNKYKRNVGLPGELYGLHHLGIRTSSLDESIDFFSGILGGTLMEELKGDHFFGSALQNALFQQEMIKARQTNANYDDLGIGDFVKSDLEISLRFVLFDNFILEQLMYARKGDKTNGYNPRHERSSPALIHNMQIGLQLQNDVKMNDFMHDVLKKSKSKFGKVIANPIVDDPKLNGYKFAFVKGPMGEQLVFSQFTGKMADIIKSEMLAYGSLSTAYEETNPWTWDGFKESCSEATDTSHAEL
ncbi:unnamed protein product [Owenia fusiformis]|uniref:Uncharacterized protein n=1 Tax=Owenia fusiformis TaxID=6347 RepID=A0A8S4PVB6_OWEFU|nr:unnamed protein product [Owenia fusiformis]